MKFVPKGLVDALDSTDKFPGACIVMTNLVFNQSNPEIVISRPGVEELTDFTGITTPGVVSVQITIGTRTYGMIASARNSGKDEPFSYDNATDTLDTVTGITNGNSPSTQSSTGAWTPPTMTVVGTYILVTHPGFPGGATKFGYLDISTASAPVWAAGDTATNNLPSVPTAVANFANRAWFACGQFLVYTDVLVPLTVTNASQALTVGDTTGLTALFGLPVQTTSSGVVQALIAFKAFQIWQVTGDAATSNLAINFISLTIGTRAPRSVALSPLGLYFAADAGPYFIDQVGTVRLVTSSAQDIEADIVAPYQNAVVPSRICAAYANGVYRVCMETIIRGAQSFCDYWFDERRRRWTGPHNFRYDCASAYLNYFILNSNASTAALFRSDVVATASTVYTDDGAAMVGTLQSSTFPKTNRMTGKQVVESTIELSASGATTSYAITGLDDQFNTLNTCTITPDSDGGIWGSGTWGDGQVWEAGDVRPHVYTVPWTGPLVFKKMGIEVTATATSALAIGAFFARYQDTGYTGGTEA